MGTERVQYTVLQATLCKEQWLSLPRVNVANILERRGHLARQLHAGMLCHYSQRFSQRPKLRPFPNSSMLCARCHGSTFYYTNEKLKHRYGGTLWCAQGPGAAPPSSPLPAPRPSTLSPTLHGGRLPLPDPKTHLLPELPAAGAAVAR